VRIVPPEYVERVLILGKNGTGKSEFTFALEAAGNYRQVIYLDIKGDTSPRRPFTVVTKGDDWWGWRQRRIVYRPARGSFWHSDTGWAQILERLISRAVREYDHKRKRSRAPFLVVVPEVLLFGAKAQRVIGEIASGARQYELGLWCETQRPRRIPVVIRSEAWRLYVFPLGYEDDELEVIKYTKGRLTLEEFRELDEAVSKDDPHPFFEIVLRSPHGAHIQINRCRSLPPPPQ
jgi:hypothetical protein